MKNIFNFKLSILIMIIAAFFPNILYSQEISYGDSVKLGDGIVKTWIKTDASDNPQGIGLSLSEDVLTNLPSQNTAVYEKGRSNEEMDYPPKISNTLFNHNFFLWLPQGHPPAGIYDVPQFNVHFFIISPQEQVTAPGASDTISVDPRLVPPDYEFAFHAGYVGNHWWDTTADELHGQVFTKTLLYGYSRGKFVFYELAVSKAFLDTHPHFTGIIKQPAEFQRGGYYPATYKIDYDSVNHAFNLELTDFVLRKATPTEIPAANLQLWLKADAGVVLNGSKVSRWIDQSGNGNDAVESDTSRQPMFLGYYNINNKLVPVISFDGVNDRLGFKGSKKMSQISVFMVFKNNKGAISNQVPPGFVLTFGPSGTYKREEHFALVMRAPDNSDNHVIVGCQDNADYVTASSPNIAKYDEWRNMSIIKKTELKTSIRWNGIDATIQPTGVDFPISVTLGDSSASGGGIGSEDDPLDKGLRVLAKCDVAEIIVYDTVLSESDRLAVENYLQKKYNITVTGVEDSQNKNIPESFALYQNYPNPFNPSTTIKYSIPKASFVTLKVYDILGREITTLVNKEQKEGVYRIQFKSNNLSSGVYFYKITAGNFVSIKKFIILK